MQQPTIDGYFDRQRNPSGGIKIALCRLQEVDGISTLVDCAILVSPLAADFHASLTDAN